MAVRNLETEWLRVQIYRRMAPQQRVAIALEMSAAEIEMVRASIRYRQPDIDDDDLEFEVRKRILPPGLAELTESARREHVHGRK